MVKNNVIRLLEQRKIAHTVYELPESKLGAEESAQFMEVPPAIVFKTIVVTRKGGGKNILALVPGDREVDLKALAKAVGEKKVFLPTQREAEELTGLQAGGISPLALLNRGFQVVLDSSARAHKEIHVSGGQRGLNIRLPVFDLIRLTNARTAPISRD